MIQNMAYTDIHTSLIPCEFCYRLEPAIPHCIVSPSEPCYFAEKSIQAQQLLKMILGVIAFFGTTFTTLVFCFIQCTTMINHNIQDAPLVR